MFLGIYLLTALVLDLKFFEHVIIVSDVPYEVCSSLMVDLTDYDFKLLMKKLSNWKNPLLICTSKNSLSQKAQLVQPNYGV